MSTQRREPSVEEIRALAEWLGRTASPHVGELVSVLLAPSNSGAVVTTYEFEPRTLARDVGELARALDAAQPQRVRIWSIALPEPTTFDVFELVDDARIAGVVKSIDRHMIAE